MKKILCPYCNKKIKTDNICPYCYEKINEGSIYKQKVRSLLVASRINNEKFILEAANALLEIDENNILGKYFYSYAQLKVGNNEPIIQFLNSSFIANQEDVKEIIYHLIRYKKEYSFDDIKNFIVNHVNEVAKMKAYLEMLENGEDDFLDIQSLPLIDLPRLPYRNKIIPLALFLIIAGCALISILSFTVFKLFNESNIIFSTILLFIFPCSLVGMGLTRLILKKGNSVISLIFMLFILIIYTYYLLLPYQETFMKHVENVFTSPYDLIMYFVRKVFLNL